MRKVSRKIKYTTSHYLNSLKDIIYLFAWNIKNFSLQKVILFKIDFFRRDRKNEFPQICLNVIFHYQICIAFKDAGASQMKDTKIMLSICLWISFRSQKKRLAFPSIKVIKRIVSLSCWNLLLLYKFSVNLFFFR